MRRARKAGAISGLGRMPRASTVPATAPTGDQRGKRRGKRKDVGAYERNTGDQR